MKDNKVLIIYAIGIIACAIALGWYGINFTLKTITWEQKEVSGQVNEIILYNTFPDNELLVTFKDGEFVVITRNFMGSYAILSQLSQNATVTISYERNGFNEVYVKEIEWEE